MSTRTARMEIPTTGTVCQNLETSALVEPALAVTLSEESFDRLHEKAAHLAKLFVDCDEYPDGASPNVIAAAPRV